MEAVAGGGGWRGRGWMEGAAAAGAGCGWKAWKAGEGWMEGWAWLAGVGLGLGWRRLDGGCWTERSGWAGGTEGA